MLTATVDEKRSQDWAPNSEQQIRFLSSPAFEALFGGAAGPGKTDCLLMETARQVWHPDYTAILFRRTFPMLEAANGIIQRSLHWYTALGGKYNQQKHYWTFPSGAMIYFGHMQHTKDRLQYQGAEFCFVGFDELTEFEREQYLYMFTRCRTPKTRRSDEPLRAYVRSATNPGNIGHQWVKTRFITRDIVNRVRYFAIGEDGNDTEVDEGHPEALSRAFYPGRLEDNPDADAGYARRIKASGDKVQIARLLGGDWDAEHTEGRVYETWSSQSWPAGNVTNEAEYKPGDPVYWAVDDGYVYGDGPGHENYHPRVILFCQYNFLGGIDVFHELYVTGETHSETILTAFKPPEIGYSETYNETEYHIYEWPDVVYIDSSAAMFKGELHKLGLTTINSTHIVIEGIRAVRNLILDGNKTRLLRVHTRCQNFIYEMGQYRLDPKDKSKGGELLPAKIDDHGPDAIRYLVYKKRLTLA